MGLGQIQLYRIQYCMSLRMRWDLEGILQQPLRAYHQRELRILQPRVFLAEIKYISANHICLEAVMEGGAYTLYLKYDADHDFYMLVARVGAVVPKD